MRNLTATLCLTIRMFLGMQYLRKVQVNGKSMNLKTS
jgi:hypothetical protein